jgi:hypothetical protein
MDDLIPERTSLRDDDLAGVPEVSEVDIVRHFHADVHVELLDRSRDVSARFVHYEVQLAAQRKGLLVFRAIRIPASAWHPKRKVRRGA